jgi:hypothetical protein
LIFAFDAPKQPSRLNVVPSGMNTGPETPGLPLWMWAAKGLPSIFVIENSQQTLRAAGFNVISTRPRFDAGAAGTSFVPRS